MPDDERTPTNVLAALTASAAVDDRHTFGVLTGLFQVCVAGTRITAEDLATADSIGSVAQAEIAGALDKVSMLSLMVVVAWRMCCRCAGACAGACCSERKRVSRPNWHRPCAAPSSHGRTTRN